LGRLIQKAVSADKSANQAAAGFPAITGRLIIRKFQRRKPLEIQGENSRKGLIINSQTDY
jgi:hypothetical protein